MATNAPAYPYVRTRAPYLAPALVVVAVVIEVLAAFHVALGGVDLVPLGLAVFFLAFL
jgi:hypothetical protein